MNEEDRVNNPHHYKQGNMEAIEIMENMMSRVEFAGYLKGNVIKYLSRYEHKGKPVEDLAKAQWYINKLKEFRMTF